MKNPMRILIALIASVVVMPMANAAVRESPRVGVNIGTAAGPRAPSLRGDGGVPVTLDSDNTALPGGNASTLRYDEPGISIGYTVDNCMSDIDACVRGALNGTINELYDADARSDLLLNSGMCSSAINYCITNVMVNGRTVYQDAMDVWYDFNSRVIMPEYYDFVVRATGLSPAQAEYTCLLLDHATESGVSKNLIGRVGMAGPAGWVSINDMMTGNAKWDAAMAECHVRVGAYNKNNSITNSWLFGIAGDNRPAEVWKKTGDVFTCNKDLFGFGLMTNTKTAAVVGVGGGAVVGGATGAIIGHNQKRDFSCDNSGDRANLINEMRQKDLMREIPGLNSSVTELTVAQCLNIKQTAMLNQKIANLETLGGRDGRALQGALIGAGTGAAAGGVATAITSFVERNNISCRIGNNADTVGYNKSASIDSLKDYYTKWNLNMAEYIGPDNVMDSCAAFRLACESLGDAYYCSNATIVAKPESGARAMPIMGACRLSNGGCTAIDAITLSNAICE